MQELEAAAILILPARRVNGVLLFLLPAKGRSLASSWEAARGLTSATRKEGGAVAQKLISPVYQQDAGEHGCAHVTPVLYTKWHKPAGAWSRRRGWWGRPG